MTYLLFFPLFFPLFFFLFFPLPRPKATGKALSSSPPESLPTPPMLAVTGGMGGTGGPLVINSVEGEGVSHREAGRLLPSRNLEFQHRANRCKLNGNSFSADNRTFQNFNFDSFVNDKTLYHKPHFYVHIIPIFYTNVLS